MMKSYQPHLLRRTLRHIPAAIAALSLALASAGYAKPSDFNARLAKYDAIPGAEKISTKLLRAQDDVKAGKVKGAAASDQLKGVSRTKDGAILIEVVCNKLDDSVVAKLKATGATVRDSYPQYDRAYVLVSNLSAVNEIAKLDEVSLVRPVYRPVTHLYEFSGAANSRAPRGLKASPAVDAGVDGSGVTVGILSDSFAETAGVRKNDTTPPFGFEGILQHARNQDNTTTNGSDLPSGTPDSPPYVRLVRDDQFDNNNEGAADLPQTDEGGAMGELVHDVAPKANIAFHTAHGGQGVFANGIERLRNEAGAKILVDDVIYFDEPMFQDGIVAQAAANAVKSGVSFFSSSGNEGDAAIRDEYKDINPNDNTPNTEATVTGNDLHDWGNGSAFLPISIPAGQGFHAVMQWNQPFQSLYPKVKAGKSGAKVNMDFFLCNTPDINDVIAAGDDPQGESFLAFGDAVEHINIQNGATTRTVFLAVNVMHGHKKIPQNKKAPVEFRIVFFNGNPVIQNPVNVDQAHVGPAIYGHSVAAGVLSVGAIPWWESPQYQPDGGFFGPSPEIDPESFSARGASNLHISFTNKGKYKLRSFFAPNITAVDGNSTTFFAEPDALAGNNNPAEPSTLPQDATKYCEPDGFPNFFGTSASAPNAAAVAALLLDKSPGLKPAEIAQILQDTAIDVKGARTQLAGDPGLSNSKWDPVSGFGLIDAKAALAQVGQSIGDPGAYPACDNGDGGPTGGTPQDVDLVPALISGDPIVVATSPGQTSDASTIHANDHIFVSYGAKNNGPDNEVGTFVVKLRVDGVLKDTFSVTNLAAGASSIRSDADIGFLPVGNHTFTVTVDANGNVDEQAGGGETNNVASEDHTVVPTQNDTLPNAIEILGEGGNCGGKCLGHLLSSNVGATTDTDDIGTTAGATVWYKYVAEAHDEDYQVTFDTAGSDFNTILAAYQHISDVPKINILVAENDDIFNGTPDFVQSQITVFVPANQTRTFYINVGGSKNAQGTIRLNWACDGVRKRDMFNTPGLLTTQTLIYGADSNKSATEQPGEVDPFGIADYLKDNWYVFTVTSDTLGLGEVTRPVRITVTELPDTDYVATVTLVSDAAGTYAEGHQAYKPRFNPIVTIFTGSSFETIVPYAAGLDPRDPDNSEYYFDYSYSQGIDGRRRPQDPDGETTRTNARKATVTFIGVVGETYTIQVTGLPTTCDPETASAGVYDFELEQLQNNFTGFPNLTFKPKTFYVSNFADGMSTDSLPIQGSPAPAFIDFTVINDGASTSVQTTAIIRVDGGDRQTINIPSLGPGKTASYQDVNIGPLDAGNRTITINIDPDQIAPESNEADNSVQRVISVTPTGP